jgi:hypothetical protein
VRLATGFREFADIPTFGAAFHAGGGTAPLLHDQEQPTLIVNDLKTGAQGKVAVALWSYHGTLLTSGTFVRSHLSIVKIVPAPTVDADPDDIRADSDSIVLKVGQKSHQCESEENRTDHAAQWFYRDGLAHRAAARVEHSYSLESLSRSHRPRVTR